MKATHYTRVAPGLVLLCAMSQAQPAENIRLAFDIHAKQMEEALTEFAQATQLQVLFQSEVVREQRAAVVSGALTPEVALQQLLADSGLRYEFVNAKTVAIRPDLLSDAGSRGRSHFLETVEPGGGSAQKYASNDGPGDPSTASDAATRGIPEILVKGARSLNADIERTRDDVRPYVVINRKTIERSGAKDVDELIRQKLPMSYVRTPNGTVGNTGSISGNSSQVALRGLASTETLILVDGRRTSTTMSALQEAQSDLNAIPLSAIERIEVLPATASGIYGGAATGGVVNVVLRRDYVGLESTVDYENTFSSGAQTKRVSVFGGASSKSGNTSLLVNGSYADSDPLSLADRGFAEDYRQRFQEDQIARAPTTYYNAANPILGRTTNISSARVGAVAPTLVLKSTGQTLNSSITSVPIGYAGVQSDGGAALIANAGRYNTDLADSSQSSGGRNSLLGGPHVGSFDVTLRQKMGSRVDAFVDVSASRNDQFFVLSNIVSRFTLPSTSAANPFRQSIVVVAPIQTGDDVVRTRSDSGRALVGATVRLSDDWSSGFDYSYSSTKASQSVEGSQFKTAGTNAVNSGAINVLQDPAAYSDQLLSFVVPDSVISPMTSRLHAVSARVGGTLFSIPAGRVKLSVLGEGEWQHYGEYFFTAYLPTGTPNVTHATDGNSETRSAYSEITVPLISELAPLLGIRSAELQMAGRFDHYNLRAAYVTSSGTAQQTPSTRTLNSVDPTVGLRVQPVQDITLRGSYGTGFRPPYLRQLQEVPTLTRNLFGITDPKRGNEVVSAVPVTGAGNPDLKPEQSESVSAGMIITPRMLPDLRLSTDWTRITKRDNIIGVTPIQDFFVLEDFMPGLITRGPVTPGDPFGVGRIVSFDGSNRNAARALSESVDFTVDYTFRTAGLGDWSFGAAATKLIHISRQATPGVASVEQAGTASFPNLAANTTLTWNYRNISVFAAGRYLDSHWVNVDSTFNALQGSARVPSQHYLDLGAEYDFGKLDAGPSSLFNGLRLQLGAKNVTNRKPRYLATNTTSYFDSWDDPKMASYFVSIRKSFGN